MRHSPGRSTRPRGRGGRRETRRRRPPLRPPQRSPACARGRDDAVADLRRARMPLRHPQRNPADRRLRAGDDDQPFEAAGRPAVERPGPRRHALRELFLRDPRHVLIAAQIRALHDAPQCLRVGGRRRDRASAARSRSGSSARATGRGSARTTSRPAASGAASNCTASPPCARSAWGSSSREREDAAAAAQREVDAAAAGRDAVATPAYRLGPASPRPPAPRRAWRDTARTRRPAATALPRFRRRRGRPAPRPAPASGTSPVSATSGTTHVFCPKTL